METSPFLKLQEDPIENRLDFQLSRLGSGRETHPPSCDASLSFIRYEIYAYFLHQNDYSEEELFRGIRLMTDPQSVVQIGKKVIIFQTIRRTRALVFSYPGRGVIYSVLAKKGDRVAAYVPVASYNCDLESGIAGCGKMNQILAVILLSILSVTGLVVTFRGHQWFTFQICCSSYLSSLIVLLIILAKHATISSLEREVIAMSTSAVVTLVWYLIWRLLKRPLISVIPSGLLFGFLVISSVLFSTLGNEELFRSELNYWIILSSGSIIIPAFLLPFGNLLSILSTSIVGSYCFVFSADRFIGGSLSFIVLNVLKRAAFKDVVNAYNQVPFQTKDISLASVWLILSLIGITVQLYMDTRQRPRRVRSNSVRLNRRLRRRSHRRSISRSRSRSRTRRRTRSVARATSPPTTEVAQENHPLIIEAPPITYSAI